jgi:hypothetical protein
MAIKPAATCPYCHGTGLITDWVDYGSTRVPMDSDCDCVFEDETDEPARELGHWRISDCEVTFWYMPGNAPYYYCVYQNGFMIGEYVTEAEGLVDFTKEKNFQGGMS